MLPSNTISALHNATCAVGYITVSHPRFLEDVKKPYFKVLGTAFLVREGLVMTNRHVIQALLAQQEDLGITDEQRILMFVYPKKPGLWNITIAIIKAMGHILNRDVDVGLISFAPPEDPEFAKVRPLAPQKNPPSRVTEEIAICGYPFGHAMLQKDGKVYRWGPLIQQGHISAISPYENTQHPTELMLDVRIAPGMSGAPVVRPSDSALIGIVHSTWEATAAVAFPLDERTLTDILASHDKQSEAA